MNVSFRIRRLEFQIAAALAGVTVCAGVFLYPNAPTAWVIAVYAGAIAGWAHAYPARRTYHLFVRAVMLLAAAFVLHAAPELGGPGAVWFLWPLVIAMAYGLLLPSIWAWSLIGMVMVEFTLACIVSAQRPDWQHALVLASTLWFLPAMMRAFGESLRASDERAEQAQRDRSTALYNEDGFFSHGGELYERCKRAKKPLTMILLNASDLRDAVPVMGKKAANAMLRQMVDGIAAITPPDALAARTDTSEFAIVLPGLTAERAQELLHRQLGNPPKLEIERRGEKGTVMLDAVVVQAPSELRTLEDFYDRAREHRRGRSEMSDSDLARGPDTLQGLLLDNPPLPLADRPTLPMALNSRL